LGGVLKNRQPKFYLACYLVLRRGNEVLLLKRFNTGFQDGKYSMVAGHLDGNETVKAAIRREAKEEANLDISLKDLEIVHVLHRKTPEREYVDFFLSARKWRNEIRNMEPEKCSELRWFGIDRLPRDTIPYIRFVINKISRKEFYSEYGFR
jgi:8-oxo-dGTP diphosphatase